MCIENVKLLGSHSKAGVSLVGMLQPSPAGAQGTSQVPEVLTWLFGFRQTTAFSGPLFPLCLTSRWLAASSKVNFCTRRCLFWKRRDPRLLRSDSSSIIKS